MINTILGSFCFFFNWEGADIFGPKSSLGKFQIFSYPSVLTYLLGAQKNRLNESLEIRKYFLVRTLD